MIYLNREIKSVFQINQDLVVDYKRTCDRILVNIRRNLTRQLIFYKVYCDLQEVYNSYYVIIDKLINELYDSSEDMRKDYAVLTKCCKAFIRNATTIVPENIHEVVSDEIDQFLLAMDKLIYILENYCEITED